MSYLRKRFIIKREHNHHSPDQISCQKVVDAVHNKRDRLGIVLKRTAQVGLLLVMCSRCGLDQEIAPDGTYSRVFPIRGND